MLNFHSAVTPLLHRSSSIANDTCIILNGLAQQCLMIGMALASNDLQFKDYESSFHASVVSKIEHLGTDLPQEVFTMFLEKVYKRNK